MTEREFRKLRRQDLLELFQAQGRQKEELRAVLEQTSRELEEIRASNECLRAQLEEKDALIGKIEARLGQKNATIENLESIIKVMQESRRIELEEAGSIAMAALQLNGVFETAQKAAEQYLENIRELVREKYGDLADRTDFPTVVPRKAGAETGKPGILASLEQTYASLAEYFNRKTH